MGYPRRLPVRSATRVQHIMVDVEPPNVVVALGGQVQQIGSTVAAHPQHQRCVLRPVEVGVAFEGFLNSEFGIIIVLHKKSQLLTLARIDLMLQ